MSERLPFLLALQYCPGDKIQAMALARLLADIEQKPNPNMGFLFCPRYDVIADGAIVERVRESFPDCSVLKMTNRQVGWPKAPNAMAHEVYNWFCDNYGTYARIKDGKHYCAIMLAEPDSIPLDRDWVAKLQEEWYTCDWEWPLGNKQHVLGCWQVREDCGCPTPHINGNCMISPDFRTVYPQFTSTSFAAWDTTHARGTTEFGRPSKLIFSDYNVGGNNAAKPFTTCADLFRERQTAETNPLNGKVLRPVWLHGIKDIRGIACAREVLGVPEKGVFPVAQDRFNNSLGLTIRGQNHTINLT